MLCSPSSLTSVLVFGIGSLCLPEGCLIAVEHEGGRRRQRRHSTRKQANNQVFPLLDIFLGENAYKGQETVHVASCFFILSAGDVVRSVVYW